MSAGVIDRYTAMVADLAGEPTQIELPAGSARLVDPLEQADRAFMREQRQANADERQALRAACERTGATNA